MKKQKIKNQTEFRTEKKMNKKDENFFNKKDIIKHELFKQNKS